MVWASCLGSGGDGFGVSSCLGFGIFSSSFLPCKMLEKALVAARIGFLRAMTKTASCDNVVWEY